MIKRITLLFLFSCIAGSLSAQGLSLPNEMYVGAGIETNGFSRSGATIGGNLLFGLDFDINEKYHFSAGPKIGFYDDLSSLSAVEFLLFFRYYLPWLHLPKSDDGPFAQVELGSVLIIERGYHNYNEVFPHFLGGISAGWRFNFLSNWFVEPSLRLGYPHIWGFNVTAGIRFKQKESVISYVVPSSHEQTFVYDENDQITEQITESDDYLQPNNQADVPWQVLSFVNENDTEEHLLVVRDSSGNLRIQVPSVVFRANHADFSGLSAALLDSNGNTLRRIAQMLNAYNDFKILIEGHANPTTPEGRRREAEEDSLRQLSEDRAKRVADELVRLGVNRNRLVISGMSSSNIIVPYNDRSNSWKNRRVEFILLEGDINE